MRKRLKINIECGDANYVKPGEYFANLSADGKSIVSLQKRLDDLSMETVVDTPVTIETNKEVTITSSPATVNPTSGKDAMAKATVTVATEVKSQEVSIASLTAGSSIEIIPSEGKVGLTKVTINFVE